MVVLRFRAWFIVGPDPLKDQLRVSFGRLGGHNNTAKHPQKVERGIMHPPSTGSKALPPDSMSTSFSFGTGLVFDMD
jgi:hypothetical protein